MKTSFNKKLAVVTGASSGIGYELAKQFAAHDFDLLIAAEDPGIVEAAQACEAIGATVEAVQVDLTTYEGVEVLYGRIVANDVPVEAIAINAGVGVGGGFVHETDLQAELDMIRLNVISLVHLAKRVLPDMVERGEGRVLFTSSIAATAPGPFLAVYAATKAFVQSFSQAIREEIRGSGVTVTALMPGATDTNFFERAGMENTKVGEGDKDDPADVARQGFKAMMSGKDHIIAGSFMNKVQGVTAKILPEPTKAKAQRQQTEPQDAPASHS